MTRLLADALGPDSRRDLLTSFECIFLAPVLGVPDEKESPVVDGTR